jgi:Bacterial Ig-like domain (group 3)
MKIIQPRIGLLLVSAALLATGVSSMAVAAQNQAVDPLCYSTCITHTWITQAWTIISYGNEQVQVFHATVNPVGTRQAPTGTVTIKSGSTILCTIVLPTERSCSPSPNALPVGIHSARGYYSGDARFSPSVSNVTTFQVRRFGSGD